MQNIFTRADKKGFKNGIFPLNYDEEEEEEFKDKEKKKIRNKIGLIDYEKLEKLIDLKNPTEMILEFNRQ